MNSDSKRKFWDLKPFWCQPWSIIVFGILVLIFSWMLFNNIFITSTLTFLVISWWVLFLIIAPSSYELIPDEKE